MAVEGLEPLRTICFWLMGIGVYALFMGALQTTCFEVVAVEATKNMRLKWFKALLRQDQAFFDVYDVGGIANTVNPASTKYRRGIGRKFGEGIEFFTCGVGGIAYALFEDWKIALVVLSTCPIAVFFAMGVVRINQTKTARSAQAYSKAGSVAYSTVSGIKTVLSLNAAPAMIQQYKEATQEAFVMATRPLVGQGFVNGGMLASFMVFYVVLTLYGMRMIYKDVMEIGCDPSVAVPDNITCETSGQNVFGAMLGIAFAGQGISQVGTFLETFSMARVAAGQAIESINREPGHPEEKIYHVEDEKDKGDDNESVTSSSQSSHFIESPEGRIKAILPAYEIDAMSNEGLKPSKVEGQLSFDKVQFNYPTRPGQTVLNDLSIDIPAGTTTAFVGPSGGGKSTVVKLLERFYDPTSGSVKLDGTDMKEINVKHLRSMIGYVGQEPTLFATTIGKNIEFGLPGCSQEQIEEAAKQANAHGFIMQLPGQYNTDVGDKGSQLSGGQKQRIAIARVLIGDPKILLLDEATSALDTQSELIVQEALENIISTQKRTTVIIAHRLSTIRNADNIAVVTGGTIIETGTHDVLMGRESYYKKLVETQSESAVSKRKSSIQQINADGQSESQRGFEKVPNQLVDTDAAPLIVFRNVNFTYPTRPNKIVLEKFKLKIYKGETIGLCGISGGGKSTVMGLIERFYDPDTGSVEYYGEDVKDLNVKWFRNQIGYVGQEPTLFKATIAENIAFGAPGVTKEQIVEAAKQANAYDFIMKFPQDFDTPISGGAGTELSGGQKQRIAIARALVKQPEILLLDEATSALDNESERIVQEALDNIMRSNERTCIVIAHRLSTIRDANRIAFIGDGRVKEIGSHEELMEKPNGKYKRLVESQGRKASTLMHGLAVSKKKKKAGKETDEEDAEENFEKQIEDEESSSFSMARAMKLASPDALFLLFGAVGALLSGSVFPAWGLLFAGKYDSADFRELILF
jgi:ATP-binding cassette subfamily B (MDR/TAP) protein 1